MSGCATGLTRRGALQLAGAGALFAALTPWAWAAGKTGLHGLSVFGDLKYPAGFTQFDYVNPNAPKGGRMNFQPPNWYFNQNTQTFNTLNTFVLKGDAPPRMELCFDTLMTRAADEPDAMYGLLAETVDVSEDGNVFTFHLRPEARFHDGSPLTAEDVAFSFMLIKGTGHPNLVAGDPRDGEGRRRRPGDGGRDALRQADPRHDPDDRRAAGVLEGLLHGATIPRRDARSAARLRGLQGRAGRAPGGTSSTSASPTIGARTCRSMSGTTIST